MGRAAILVVFALASCSPPEAPAPVPAPVPAVPEPPPEPWEIEKDPVRARTMKLQEEWRLDPAFTDLKLRFVDARPALVALEEKEGFPSEKIDALGESVGGNIRLLAGRVREFLREAGVEAPALADMGDERVRVMVFRSKESFDAWHTRNRIASNLNSHYSRSVPRIVTFVGETDAKVCFQLGTFALFHAYARHFVQIDDDRMARKAGETPVPVELEDHRLPSAFAWFERGLAKYFGDFRVESGVLEPGDTHEDLAYFQFMKESKKVWPLDELLFRDSQQIRAHATVKGGGVGMGDQLQSVAWVQGGLLVRYLLEGEDGKWRSAFQRMIGNEIRGRSAKPYLLEAFGLVDASGRAVKSGDPRIGAWLREVETGYHRFIEGLSKPR